MANTTQAPKFLLVFKDTDEIERRQVYSYPALYWLVDRGLIEFQKGPSRPEDIYRITDAGKKMLAEVVTNGER